jgi:pimeloyl-ACP methyl ester carboxylesterase
VSVTRAVQLAPRAPALEVLDLSGRVAAAPLVLLHEGLGSVALWREFPRQLHERTGRRVIAFSRYGHGASDPPPRPRTPTFHYEEALEVLPALLSELQVGAPVLVGHSDGASIALVYAAAHPVAALVLLAPHVFIETLTLRAIEDTRREYLEGELRGRMSRRHADPDAAFWGWCDVWLDPAFRDWNLDAEVARVYARTLLVQGADDPYGTLEQLDRIEAAMPGRSEREVVSGGHSPHREHGEWLADRITTFLAD